MKSSEVLIIDGQSRLNGEVKLSGSKNASLPIIISTLLVKGESYLTNIPDLIDIQNLLMVMRSLGVEIKDGRIRVVGKEEVEEVEEESSNDGQSR